MAICISLCVHAWAVRVLLRGQIGAGGMYAAGIWPREVKQAKPHENPAKRAHDRPLLPPSPPPSIYEEFGEKQGTGDAINSMMGQKPLRAKSAPLEQAALTRQPGVHRDDQQVQPKLAVQNQSGHATNGGRQGLAEKMLTALEPRNSTTPQMLGMNDAGATPSTPETAARVTPSSSADAISKTKQQEEKNKANNSRIAIAKQIQVKTAQAKPSALSSQQKLPTPQKQILAAGNGGGITAGQAGQVIPTPAGDPGEKSDSESDAFSHEGSVVFDGGRLEARFGRQIKTVRPNFSLSGRMDLWNMVNPSVQLEVHADINGNPTDVEVLQSSGSGNVDEPVRLAVYQWWFEPPKNRFGKPMSDVMVWTISFR